MKDTQEAVERLNENDLKENKKPFVYQIYGDHPVYGQNVLLYIGRTTNKIDRQEHHTDFKFERGLNLSIRFASIPETNGDSHKLLAKIEALLIASIKPSYNSAGLMNSKLLNEEQPFIVQNCNNRGLLPLECSSIWWYSNEVVPYAN